MIECLEAEGVSLLFGIPVEKNIRPAHRDDTTAFRHRTVDTGAAKMWMARLYPRGELRRNRLPDHRGR